MRGFYIRHPFHPLYGCWFEQVARRYNWAEERVYCHDHGGRLRGFPAAWTSVEPEDPFVAVSAERSHFRVCDLIELAGLLDDGGSAS